MCVILVKWPNSYTLTTEATDQEEPIKFACMRNIEEQCCLFCISVFLILHLESDFLSQKRVGFYHKQLMNSDGIVVAVVIKSLIKAAAALGS